MAQFSYKARRRSGEVIQGTVEGADRAAAALQVEKLGLLPVAVEAVKGAAGRAPLRGPGAGAGAGGGGTARNLSQVLPPALRALLTRRRRPKLQELATFTQQLANLLKSGMPLTVALNSMTHLESKGISKDVSVALKTEVMEGRSLSDAMSQEPRVFSDLYVNMVRAGEQSGALVDVLRRLAAHYERFAEVQSKFTSALIYPAVVACVGVGIIIFFMSFMLPRFLNIFQGLRVQLPPSTQLLITISNAFSNPGYLAAMGLMAAAVVVLFLRFRSTEAGRRAIDSWKMNAPIVGRVVRLNLFGQFARTLATLLTNGVPVLTALKITEQVIGNRVLREAIAQTREAVTDGKTLAEPLARGRIFPQLMIDLLRIGEETGDVPGALENLADTYENELAIALRVMTNLIEPAMIIAMAVGVGLLLFSVLSAMFAITSNISNAR
jgi:type II secretory pathway component PulF